eukprot:sb/3465412/
MKLKLVDTTNITTVQDINTELNLSELGYNILLSYHSIATIWGLLGNIIVLYGSMRYKAISVDKISTILVETLAILDLTIVVTFVIPVWCTLIGRRWILGPVLCYIQGFVGFSCSMVEMTVIQMISIYRFYSLCLPFSARAIDSSTARKFVAGVIVFIGGYMLCIHLMGQYWFFSPGMLSCQPSGITDPRDIMMVYTIVATVLTVMIPVVTIIVSNIGILIIVGRSNFAKMKREIKCQGPGLNACSSSSSISNGKNKLRQISSNFPGKKAIVTVCLVAWVFVVAVTPMMVRILLQTRGVELPEVFLIISIEMLFLNSLANPMIYTVTNKRFRRFLMNWLQRDTSSVSDGGSHGNHFNGNGTSAVGNFTVKHVEGHQLSVARSMNSLQRNTPTLPRTGR